VNRYAELISRRRWPPSDRRPSADRRPPHFEILSLPLEAARAAQRETLAEPVLAEAREAVGRVDEVLGDKGFDADAVRGFFLEELDALPVIPNKKNREEPWPWGKEVRETYRSGIGSSAAPARPSSSGASPPGTTSSRMSTSGSSASPSGSSTSSGSREPSTRPSRKLKAWSRPRRPE
jgi:hypothetical protein